MKNNNKRNVLLSCIFLGVAILSDGCAESAANYRVIQPLKQGIDMKSYMNLELKAESKENIPIAPYDMDRITNLIVRAVKEKASNRFKELNPPFTKPSTVQYTFIFTRYDKGNAFARFMLAGLGQIHIDADVLVKDKAKNDLLAQYRINKTFTLGGFYGGVTRIEHCEEGFAEGAANLILKLDKSSVKAGPSRTARDTSDGKKAIEPNPNDAVKYLNQGNAYYRSHQFDLSIIEYNRAIEINPKYAAAYYNRGNTYASLGKFEEAKTDLLTAVRLKPALKPNVNRSSDVYKLGIELN